MKKVNCNFFKDGEYLMFNIQRLSEFESAIGTSIGQLLQMPQWPINTIVTGYAIGMKQHKRNPQQYFGLIDELLNDDEKAVDLNVLQFELMKALIASGVFGKRMYYQIFEDERTDADVIEIEEETKLLKN